MSDDQVSIVVLAWGVVAASVFGFLGFVLGVLAEVRHRRSASLEQRVRSLELADRESANVVLRQQREGDDQRLEGTAPPNLRLILWNAGKAAAREVVVRINGEELLPSPFHLAPHQTKEILVAEKQVYQEGWGVPPNFPINWSWEDDAGEHQRSDVTID